MLNDLHTYEQNIVSFIGLFCKRDLFFWEWLTYIWTLCCARDMNVRVNDVSILCFCACTCQSWMSHGILTNDYERHTRMSHGTHTNVWFMNESWPTYEYAIHEWVITHIRMCHSTRANETYRAYEYYAVPRHFCIYTHEKYLCVRVCVYVSVCVRVKVCITFWQERVVVCVKGYTQSYTDGSFDWYHGCFDWYYGSFDWCQSPEQNLILWHCVMAFWVEDINRLRERAYLSYIMAVLTDTGWRRPIACLKLQVIFAKEPLIIGLFCGIWPMKIRHPMGLRHPVLWLFWLISLWLFSLIALACVRKVSTEL